MISVIEHKCGKFTSFIEDNLDVKRKIRILDAGCFRCHLLALLLKRYGNKVELTGFNYSERDGNIHTMLGLAVDKGIFTEEEIKSVKNLPKIIYTDANKDLPFSSGSFDLIICNSTMHLLEDKIHFLEECNRILDKGGKAFIASALFPFTSRRFSEDLRKEASLEIWHNGKKIDPIKYLSGFKGIEIEYHGMENPAIKICKQPSMNFNLQLLTSIDTNYISPVFTGIKSIYRTCTQKKWILRWKDKT